jgi:hypothetical protein
MKIRLDGYHLFGVLPQEALSDRNLILKRSDTDSNVNESCRDTPSAFRTPTLSANSSGWKG